MLEMIKACYEIRALDGRRKLGLALQPADKAALEVLKRLFYRRKPSGQGSARRFPLRVPALFQLAGGPVCDGLITNLSPDGAFVSTATPARAGAEITLRVRDPRGRREWHFSALVARQSGTGMGVQLVGIPVECRYSVLSSGDLDDTAHAA
jgi:hypothetical protein